MEIKDFIQRNCDFGANFPARHSTQKILIEEPLNPAITHANALFTIVLNQSKSLVPVWLYSPNYDISYMKSYVPIAEYTKIPKLSYFSRLRIVLIAVWKFAIICITRNVLSFSYDGVKYGDLVYDTYLVSKQSATMKRIDLYVLFFMYICITRHVNIYRILKSDTFEAVMVSHIVGISSGVILRTALRHGYKGYVRAGHHRAILRRLEKLDEVYDFTHKPFPEDVDTIITKLGLEFDKAYESILDKQVSGTLSEDSRYVFSVSKDVGRDRDSFLRSYGLDPGKRNVFIMLHAFNDWPHSNFRRLIFKDYYNWFRETLRFALKNDQSNWIFKQHPLVKFYATKDVLWDSLFANCPRNVIYINENDQIDTRSLSHYADVIITCVGSAGFQLPSIAGIPSVIAGDSFYTGLGFTLEPKTTKQYFELLRNAHEIERLTPEQQKSAQAAYMHIYQFARVDMSACPLLSLEEDKDSNQYKWYWQKVYELYNTEEKTILNEMRDCITQVSRSEFKRLNSLESYLAKNTIRK